MHQHLGIGRSYLLVFLAASLLLGCPFFESEDERPPFDTPFDFSDDFYRLHGVDPDLVINRLTPSHPSAVFGMSRDSTRNNTRILQVFGGYDAVGMPLYYPLPPGPFKFDAFLDNAVGQNARLVADKFRAFIFPRHAGDPLGSAAPNRREDNLFDTSSGYFTENPLGLWRLTFPRYTHKALFTNEGQEVLDKIRARNGEDLDGTPAIRRLSEILELEDLGLLELRQRPEDGSMGPPWVV